MENTNLISQVKLTKESLKAESSHSLTPTILIEEIMEPRNNPKYQGVRMRWVTERGSAGTSLTSFALGGASSENRVAIQTFSKDVIAKFGIEVGKNMNSILGRADMELARLSISEITESDYEGLSATDQAGYSAKVNPSSGELLMHKGEQIYRRVFFDSVTNSDTYLATTASDKGENPVI